MEHQNATAARQIIESNKYLVLATSLGDVPWVAPLFFAHDAEYNFYFVSGKSTRHSDHIAKNPNVAVTIFDSRKAPEDADGVYVEGRAAVVGIRELPKALMLVYLRRFPDDKIRSLHEHSPKEFFGKNPRRFYKITPNRMYKLDRDNPTSVDRRVEVPLSMLRTSE